ncbi:ROK family protein [Frankia sp. ACN1ag]|uniref:ROK family protein n=1 Tax=Frankia sp. ACN1ag TaxID=102891 RepID=UPI0009F974AE|nr:ROK family protein [Frankia sp. ACN1ag]
MSSQSQSSLSSQSLSSQAQGAFRVEPSATAAGLGAPGRAGGPALAVDIGGTKIAAAIVDADGTIVATARRPVPVPVHRPAEDHPGGCTPGRGAGGSAEEVFGALRDCIGAVLAAAEVTADAVAGVGCGCAGPMQWPAGEVSPLNIPSWQAFPLRTRLRELFPGRPVLVHNDGVALVAGEHWAGAGRGVRNLLAVTVSTGVGGGLVLGDRLFHGTSGNAGHIGHVPVDVDGPDCPCGGRGCVEALASGPRTVHRARAAGWTPADGQPADGHTLAAAAAAGDEIARRELARAGTAVGAGLAASASLLDLEAAVVAGGFAQSGPIFWDALLAGFERHAGLAFVRRMRIGRSDDPARVALRGAAAFVLAPERYGWPD